MDTDIAQLYKAVIESSSSEEQKVKYFDEIRKLKPVSENRWNARWVILALVLIAFAAPLSHIFGETEVPDGILSLSSAALGALATFITSLAKK